MTLTVVIIVDVICLILFVYCMKRAWQEHKGMKEWKRLEAERIQRMKEIKMLETWYDGKPFFS